ncbi:MAG: efflux RND transporter permease subunit, partial [Gemmatimonadales bacterium]
MIAWAASRPRAVLALSLAVALAGAVAVTRLPLATRPRLELPRLTVDVSWPGASAEVVESYVTSRLEAAAQGVRGVERVASTSREGSAQLDIRLRERADVRLARLELIEAIETIRPSLPPGVRPPRVGNYVPEDLREPVFLQYALVGPYTPEALGTLAQQSLVPALSAVRGVAGVHVSGGGTPQVIVSYDAARLRALGIHADDLRRALVASRVVRPAGTQAVGRAVERPVTVRDQPAAVESLAALPVARVGDAVVRLGDVASVRLGTNDEGRFYRVNGKPAVTLTLSRLAGANALRTANRVRERLDGLIPGLWPGVRLVKEMDESEPLARELARVAGRVAIAAALVLLVLLAAFRRGRPVGLVLASVVLALAATSLALFLLRIPVNLLTIAGLGMGIGILVDNALIVVERLRARGVGAPDVRARAAREAAPAVLGTTLTTVVVLLPFLYLQGDARAAFAPFAAAFGLALGLSVLTALTLVPALGAGALE